MLATSMPPILPTEGGSWALAVVALVLLAAVTWTWVAGMRRRERREATVRRLHPAGRKAA